MRDDRIVSIGVLPLTVAPFAAGSLSPLLDSAFISLLIIHTYTGFQYVCSLPSGFALGLRPWPY